MKPRLKFIWGASQVIKGRWYVGLFGFYDREEGVPDSGLALSVRGMLAWSTSLPLAGYLTAASALFLWLDRNAFNRLGLSDTSSAPSYSAWLRRNRIERICPDRFNRSLVASGNSRPRSRLCGFDFFEKLNHAIAQKIGRNRNAPSAKCATAGPHRSGFRRGMRSCCGLNLDSSTGWGIGLRV